MSKFCAECGNPIDKGAKTCNASGAACGKVPDEQKYACVLYPEPPKKSKAPLFITLGVVLAALIAGAVILIINLSGGESGPERVLSQAVDCVTADHDADKLASLFYEYEYCKDAGVKDDIRDLIGNIVDGKFGGWMSDSYLIEGYGDDYKVTAKILDQEALNVSEVDENDFLCDCYIDDISEILKAEIELDIDGSKGSGGEKSSIYFVKAKGTWYICVSVNL